MRQRRDPFARQTLVPVRQLGAECAECGDTRRVYGVRLDSDGGRTDTLKGSFCSWACAEAYQGVRLGR